ncbi:hypothetical protein D3867_32450 (plasmid) [Azospirillum argentinense]|uniref:Uncharacterized protein n=1 Tax=Azospirillum brasilense TaxID=192 RepID=A0A4D8Q8Z2_AZOBR|nr:hypothetical protein D3867_32450 [Azospirillum argentinense]
MPLPPPLPPPLRRGGDCRCFAKGTLSREAGEGRGGGNVQPEPPHEKAGRHRRRPASSLERNHPASAG